MKKALAIMFVLSGAAIAAPANAPKDFDGIVLAYRTSMVNAKTVGNVAKVTVQEGQKVAEGDLLAQVDDTLARVNYEIAQLQADDETDIESARLQLAQAESELQRIKGLGANAAPVELQKTEYVRNLAKTQLAGKELELKRAKAVAAARKAALEDYAVRAPFGGVVAQKMIEVGETTAPVERRLFQVIDISKVYVEVHPEISHITDLASGDKAVISTDVFPDRQFAASIASVSPSIDPGGRYFGVKILVENPDELLRPGMKVQVTFPEKITGVTEAPSTVQAPAAQDNPAGSTGTKK